MRPILLLVLCFGFGATPAAAAESWTCPKPTGLAEPLACGDADLAGLESRTAGALAAATARLSAAGQTRLRDDQASWRKYLAVLCLGERQPGGAGIADCLKQEYDARRTELVRAVESIGGVTLLRNERFEARPARLADETSHPVLTLIAWPQLDRPANAAQRRWNEAMAKSAEQLAIPLDRQDPDTDIAVDYRVEFVGAELIQTLFSRDLYIHGAAHGDDTSVASLFLLQPGRPLTAEDLFDPVKPWRRGLAELAYHELAEASRASGWRLWPQDPGPLADLVAEPGRWLLEREGLVLHFDPYDIADYAAGLQDVVIAWPALGPYLQASPAVRLPPR
jgi:hypothetical protein